MIGSRRRRPRAGVLFVAGVAALTFVAWRNPTHPQHAVEVASIALTLPAFVPLLPFVYAALAASRNLSHTDSGGPGWPVTTVYVAMFTGLAALEVFIVRRMRAARQTGPDPRQQPWPSDHPWPPPASTAPREQR